MPTNNAINASSQGLQYYNGAGIFSVPTLTQHGVMVGAAANSAASLAVAATGTILTGVTGSDPVFSATPTVTSISFDGSNFMSSYVDRTSWTPSIAFGGGTTGITYTVRQGYYVRVANIIFVYAVVSLSSKGSSTGTFTITGLPFTVSNISNYNPVAVFQASQMTGITAVSLSAQFLSNTTSAQVSETKGTGAAVLLDDTVFTNTSAFYVSGFYFTA